MHEFVRTDELRNSSCGSGARPRETEEIGTKKETRYLNRINKVSIPAAGDNNWFDAGMIEENIVVTPSGAGPHSVTTRCQGAALSHGDYNDAAGRLVQPV